MFCPLHLAENVSSLLCLNSLFCSKLGMVKLTAIIACWYHLDCLYSLEMWKNFNLSIENIRIPLSPIICARAFDLELATLFNLSSEFCYTWSFRNAFSVTFIDFWSLLCNQTKSNLHLTHVAFSPDGKEVLLSYSGEHVYLFDVDPGMIGLHSLSSFWLSHFCFLSLYCQCWYLFMCSDNMSSVRYTADDVRDQLCLPPFHKEPATKKSRRSKFPAKATSRNSSRVSSLVSAQLLWCTPSFL